MYRITIDAHQRLMNGEKPITAVMINTHLGYRAYAAKEIKVLFDPSRTDLPDGTLLADGSLYAGVGSLTVIDKSGRLLDLSGLERTLQPQGSYYISWMRKDLQHISFDLDNMDGYLSKIIAKEPFLGRDVQVYVGFEALSFTSWTCLFRGTIISITPGDVFTVEADEKLNGLTDTYYAPRAGIYPNPANSGDVLPIVYGDLTDSVSGNWECPCIDTLNFVYCFAAHSVLSVAAGNMVTVYADDVLMSGGYTFNESDDYLGKGNIATITFGMDQTNKKITARGKGKPSAGVLMENIIDQVYDFLASVNSFDSSLFETTAKTRAWQNFASQGYKAAGVIAADIVYWELLQQMMASFIGSIYINGEGYLCLDIDTGAVSDGTFAGVIMRSDADFAPEKMLLANIVNQCPADYAADYVNGGFKAHTDDIGHANLLSQSTFGVQKPSAAYSFNWCRNLTSVNLMQDIIVAKFGQPLYEVTATQYSMQCMQADIADILLCSLVRLYGSDGNPLYNNLWKVIGVQPDPINNKMVFRLLYTGAALTRAHLADGTYLADGTVMAGGEKDLSAIY